MVDALSRATKVLTRGGAFVDLRPGTKCLHEVVFVTGSKLRVVARLEHPPSASFQAADAALVEARKRGFRIVGRARRYYRLPFEDLRDLVRYVNANVLERGLRPKVARAVRSQWRRRHTGTRLEMRERFQVNVLRPP